MDSAPDGVPNVGPEGYAFFDDPAALSLRRVGVIDVGSNSVRLVIFDGAARSPAYFFNEKVLCGLGDGLQQTGRLNPSGRSRALAAIRRFVALAEGMDLPPLQATATAAVRSAEDGSEFVAEVEALTGLAVQVIDGEEEARLSAQGVLLGWPDADGLVCDIGGSSMELARVDGQRVWERSSTQLGPLRLKSLPGGQSGRAKEISDVLAPLVEQIGQHKRLYLVGGSWRAIARFDMHRRGYPLAVLQDYRMTPKDLRDTLDGLRVADMATLAKGAGVSSARAALTPIAGEVLRRLVSMFRIREIVVSSYGIREGLLYEQMPHRLRRKDPLLEAARWSEKYSSRVPGFGAALHDFVSPLFASSKTDPRLIEAACLLHDVSWRAHPDYRAEVCFDYATRGNLGGINHPGRVYLGLALLHRYRNARPGNRFEPLLSLLSEEKRIEAEVLGKAMRFGAMFHIAGPARAAELRHRPKKGILELKLPPEAEPLFGEVAEARLDALARSLGATAEVIRG